MLLEINQLCKVYRGGIKANDNIDLSVREGEVFGLLGPNGAGKTTVVNQIIGLTVPTSGSISIAGIDVVAKPGYARQACSLQAQTQVPIAGLCVSHESIEKSCLKDESLPAIAFKSDHLLVSARIRINQKRNDCRQSGQDNVLRLTNLGRTS